MLKEVDNDVKVDPALQALFSEEIQGNYSEQARFDISTRGF